MTIFDGFLFWIGKTLAELGIALAIIFAFGLFLLWQEGKNQRRKREPD